MALFAVAMIVVGIAMLRRRNTPGLTDARLGRGNAPALIGLGATAGGLSGFFGIGGGFLIVPALVAATGMPIIAAVGSSPRRRRIWHDHRTELRAYRSGQLEARGSFRRCWRGWRYCRCSNFDEAGQLSWSSEHGICSTDLHYCRIHAVEGELTGCAPDHSRALIASAALQRL